LWGFRKDEEGEEEKEDDEHICMAAAGFIFLTLQTSRERKETFGEFRTYVSPADTQLVDFRNVDVGLSGGL
jgi:hypothetical protein